MYSYPCLPDTPATAPVVTPPVLLPLPPRPVREVDAVALVTVVAFVPPKLPKTRNPEVLADPKPMLEVTVDPKRVDVVVVAVFVLNNPTPVVGPVATLVPRVPPRFNPKLCPP